jgi:hypothetical protein
MKRTLGLAVLAVSACSDDAVATQTVQLAQLSFDVPADWERHDANRRAVEISEWTPDDNPRKESITVIRSQTSPAVAKAGVPALTPLLADAQKSLASVHASRVSSVTTARGLTGARIDVDFVPPGSKDRYHRVHAVFVDTTGALVHVLYTAQKPNAQAFEVVLNSLRNEEA